MKQALRIFAEIILLFNAFTAVYGGATFIADPSGGLLQMPLSMLQHSMFHDYLIPGIFLFGSIGLFSLFLYILMFIKKENYPWLVIAQGAIIEVWIGVQVLSIPYRHFLQLFYAGIGLLLILNGLWQLRLSARPGVKQQLAAG